jgi:hypothetical protein
MTNPRDHCAWKPFHFFLSISLSHAKKNVFVLQHKIAMQYKYLTQKFNIKLPCKMNIMQHITQINIFYDDQNNK